MDLNRRNIVKTAAFLTLAPTLIGPAKAEDKKKYTFYHVLWSMSDSNAQFHAKAGEDYMKQRPDVEIKYVGPENYDPAEHAKFLDTVINAKPDGIAMHISSVDALLPGLKAAKAGGIPFVSVTSHPPGKEDNEKLNGLYLTWVGAEESTVGALMGAELLKAGTPKRVAYLMAHLGHAGQEAIAAGFFKSMPDGVATDKVATGDEPQKAQDVLRSYITSHPDVGAIFCITLMNKWVTDVLDDLGRSDIKLLTDNESPSSLDCMIAKKCLASFSQQFPIQAPFAYDVLYYYNRTLMYPVGPIVTGARVINADNLPIFKKAVLTAMGKEQYEKLSPY
jgi:ABC-type sugar transport system substrate-binding protein